MSLSALEITDRAMRAALFKLKRESFNPDVRMTLVTRVPGVNGSHIVVTDDDLDEVIEILNAENQ